MGRQIQIYSIGSDLDELIGAILSADETLVLACRRKKISVPIEITRNLADVRDRSDFVLVPRQCIGDIRWIQSTRGEYSDIFASPVAEVMPSILAAGGLSRGRIYYIPSYYEGELWVTKSQEFIDSCSRVFRIVRKVFKRYEGLQGYWGPEAREWISSATSFVESPGGRILAN